MKNTRHILKVIASGLIWGLGQVFNKQYLKGVFFFFFLVLLIGIEIGTGHYGVVLKPYDTLGGSEFTESQATFFQVFYEDAMDGGDYSYQTQDGTTITYPFDSTHKITIDGLIEFLAQDLADHNPIRYFNVIEEYRATTANKHALRESDLYPTEDANEIASLRQIIIKRNLLKDPNSNFLYTEQVEGVGTSQVITYINIEDSSDILSEEDVANFVTYNMTGELYTTSPNYTKVYVKVFDNEQTKFVNLLDSSDIVESTLANSARLTTRASIHISENNVYEYFNPELIINNSIIGYYPTPFSTIVKDFLTQENNKVFYDIDGEDMRRFMMRVYFKIHPEVEKVFIEGHTNFFNETAGIFLRGYWGVITLGERSSIDYTEYNSLRTALVPSGVLVMDSLPLLGDVSTQILLEGLIGVLLSLYFLIFWIWSMLDAYKVSKQLERNEKVLRFGEYFKEVYENGFEYIILSPALFVLTFISIMPIAFGFVIAFTTISGEKSMIERFSWVGFSNFIQLFDFSSGLGETFGIAFWRVLSWTVIWAIFSTATVFFGGFFQAVILNNEHVPLKKFWRTVLILPWAIPSLLSQMVFSVIFNEKGFINTLLKGIGLYNIEITYDNLGNVVEKVTGPLADWKMLTEFSSLEGISKFFYLGETNIQWFSNPFNPTFVRIVLIIVNIWLGFPYFMALMSGIMTSIDKTLYEAATIDGATKNQLFRHITFPLVMYSTAPILIMTFSGNFNNFGVIYFITGGGPNSGFPNLGFAGDTDILISWMYKLTVDYSVYNMASVFSVLIFIFVGSITAWNLSRTRAFKEN